MPPKRSNKVNNVVEYVYKSKIKYTCPRRGLIEEEVEIKRYKTLNPPDCTSSEIELIPIIEIEYNEKA